MTTVHVLHQDGRYELMFESDTFAWCETIAPSVGDANLHLRIEALGLKGKAQQLLEGEMLWLPETFH
jgi:hypothetical protein